MGKNRSITQQLIHAISVCTAIGESKRSYKAQNDGRTDYKIFSISYRGDLKGTARELGAYMREKYPAVKRVRDIPLLALQDYLTSKAARSPEYVQKLHSHIVKLEACCSHAYGRSDWHTEQLRLPAMEGITPTEKIRDKVASEYEFHRILGVMKKPGCGQAWKAVILSHDAGLRVSEAASVKVGRLTATGGRWGCGTITLQGKEDGCKGGRWRKVDILSQDAQERLQEAVRGLQPGDYIISSKDGDPLKPDSINRSLQRAISKCPDLREHWKSNNGIHSFRKSFAQQCYDAARNAGGSKQEAADYANNQLGHGNNRTDLTAAYIENLW